MRILTLVLLSLLGSGAKAEWEPLDSGGDPVIYIDRAAVKQRGTIARGWFLQDYKAATKQGYRSARLLAEFNCAEEQWRILSFTGFDAQMAQGEVVVSDDRPGGLSYVAPRTVAASMLAELCPKPKK